MAQLRGNIDLTNITDTDEYMRWSSQFISDIAGTINGKLEFDNNIWSNTIQAVFTAANTATTFTHKLGKKPNYYVVCRSSVACKIYDAGGTTFSTRTAITLYSDVAATVYLILL